MTLLAEKLIVAVSSRVLFDLDESDAIFNNDGVNAFSTTQVENEDVPHGVANA